MRLIRTRVLTIAVAGTAAAFAAAGCGAKDAATSAKNAVDPVAQAAEATDAQQGGIAMKITGSVSAGGQTVPLNGTGTFDRKGKLGEMSITTNAAGKDITINEILSGRTIYLNSDAFASTLPKGKSWMKLDLAKAAQQQGIDLDALGGGATQDPAQLLDYLKGAGTSRRVGTEQVGGVDTTHYHVDVDIRKAAAESGGPDAKASADKLIKLAGTSTLPIDVWVDGKHLVRRESMAYDTKVQGQAMTTKMTIDMTKYGVEVDAKPPSDDETIDMTDLAGKALGQATSG